MHFTGNPGAWIAAQFKFAMQTAPQYPFLFPHCTSVRYHRMSLQYSIMFSYTDILSMLTAMVKGYQAISF